MPLKKSPHLAALRVVFFAAALFRSPPAQVFCLYQRPNEGFAEWVIEEQIF